MNPLTAIIFYSKYGFTAECAHSLSALLGSNCNAYSLSEAREINFNIFSGIILGTPVYADKAPREMRNFLQQHQAILIEKLKGAFVCCYDEPRWKEYAKTCFLELINHHPGLPLAYFGGCIKPDLLHPMERDVIFGLTGCDTEQTILRPLDIEKFAQVIK